MNGFIVGILVGLVLAGAAFGGGALVATLYARASERFVAGLPPATTKPRAKRQKKEEAEGPTLL